MWDILEEVHHFTAHLLSACVRQWDLLMEGETVSSFGSAYDYHEDFIWLTGFQGGVGGRRLAVFLNPLNAEFYLDGM